MVLGHASVPPELWINIYTGEVDTHTYIYAGIAYAKPPEARYQAVIYRTTSRKVYDNSRVFGFELGSSYSPVNRHVLQNGVPQIETRLVAV
jgi:hypothetical protein